MVTLPSDMSIYDSVQIEYDCGGTLYGFTNTEVLCSVRDNKIYIYKGF